VGSNITVLTINRKTVPAGQYFFYNSGIFRSPDKVSLTNGYILRLSLAFIQCDSLNSLVLPIEETVVIVRTMVFFKKEELYNSAHTVVFRMVLAIGKHYLPITAISLQT